jgi:3-hydroxybutyryl-CoA dehydrogenase
LRTVDPARNLRTDLALFRRVVRRHDDQRRRGYSFEAVTRRIGPGSANDMCATIACPAMAFEHVLVVGAGQMGAGIAQVVAASGRRVSLHDAAPGAVDRGLSSIERSLTKLAEKGGADPAEVLGRIEPVGELVPADLLIEAVVEDSAVKEEIFRRADEVLPAQSILASNTSSIPITSLGAVTSRPERVIGMHFFNPVPVLKLVEVIRGLETSDETARAIVELAIDLGKTPAEARDLPGFVSNRILMPFINEAAYTLLEGVADAEAIDTIAKLGFAHPMGPLALADLIGLDTCVAIMEVLHRGLGDPKYAPCPLLRQYVQAGRLGRKSGRGFYEY